MKPVLYGYSERGMLWTFFGELSRRDNANELLADLLNQTSMVRGALRFTEPLSAQILIEQSFSDFGDADVMLLLDHGSHKRLVFIEAKVRCQQHWQLSAVIGEFERLFAAGQVPFSNLFCQLYAKQRLIEALANDRRALETGMVFPPWTWPRKIGTNPVVTRAVDRLATHAESPGNATYLALVPDANDFGAAVERFERAAQVQCSQWGSLGWAQIAEFCRANQLNETLSVFEYNEGQIY